MSSREERVLPDRLIDIDDVGVIQGIGLQELGPRHVLQQIQRSRIDPVLGNGVVGKRIGDYTAAYRLAGSGVVDHVGHNRPVQRIEAQTVAQ